MYQVRLEIAEGATWVTTFHWLHNEWVEWLSARLDDMLRVPNAIYDLATLAAEKDRQGIEDLYIEVEFAVPPSYRRGTVRSRGK